MPSGKIAVAGGSGLVGRALLESLREAGYEAFAWKRPYQERDLDGVSAIINLAGENISSGRWTRKRRKSLLASRVNTLESIRSLVSQRPGQIKTLISASASGYYGTKTSAQIFSEEAPPGTDFLAGVCVEWERSARQFEDLGIRVGIVRIGVVFSEEGGALPRLKLPLTFGISAPIGSGNQWLPWIRLEDLVQVFIHLLKNDHLSGPFNAAAPIPLTNRQLMKWLATRYRRLYIPIGVPGFILRLILGEMSVIILEGSRLSPGKLIDPKTS